MSQNQFIIIDGVHYHADRPSSCRKCYFWKNRKAGCIVGKENCYYLMETPRKPRCDGCFYAKGRPCVTLACYKDLAASVRSRSKADHDFKVERSTSFSGEIVAASAPPSCRKCEFYQPGFKYRKCLFSECHYRKEIQVFRCKPLRRDRFS